MQNVRGDKKNFFLGGGGGGGGHCTLRHRFLAESAREMGFIVIAVFFLSHKNYRLTEASIPKRVFWQTTKKFLCFLIRKMEMASLNVWCGIRAKIRNFL